MPFSKLKKGNLLIAQPTNSPEVIFNKTVILIADHTKEGSVGFILNKPLKYLLQDLVPSIESDIIVYDGGPVEKDNLYFIHNIPDIIKNSILISDGIYWGGDFEMTRKLINSKVINSDNIRFFLGYSGWEKGQLEGELIANAWIVTDKFREKRAIGKIKADFWKKKIFELGGEYVIWGNAPDNPILN